ncbi:SMI1/KNR4 family protein, partial [Ursidibacter maritimus]
MCDLKNKLLTEGISLHTANQAEIDSAEQKLGCSFSVEYKTFLVNIGAISANGEEFYGLGIPENSYLNVISATLALRREFPELPIECVVLYSFGDGHQYYLYDNKHSNILYFNEFKFPEDKEIPDSLNK